MRQCSRCVNNDCAQHANMRFPAILQLTALSILLLPPLLLLLLFPAGGDRPRVL
jgi:hypothetical protein